MTGPAIRFRDEETGEEKDIDFGTPEHEAHMQWALSHGLDPMVIPVGSLIVRDAPGCRILYERFAFTSLAARLARDYSALVLYADDAGRIDAVRVRAIEQGEAPPLPFPLGT